MKKTKTIKKTVEVTETLDILCNKCGITCSNEKRKHGKSDFNQYSGLIETEIHGGYDSEVVGDMTSWKFSLCEFCLKTLVKSFKLPVDIKDDMVSSQYISKKEFDKKEAVLAKINQKEWIEAILKKKNSAGQKTTGLKEKLSKKNNLELSRIYHKL